MRKYKRAFSRQFGICVLAFTLVISIAGISKIKNAEAEEVTTHDIVFQIMTPETLYIENEVKYKEIVLERPNYKINLDEKYQDLIWELCLKNNISYELVLAVFHYESRFKFNAINTANKDQSTDVGIAQLNSYYMETHKEHAINYCDLSENVKFNPLNPDHGIRAGIGNLVHWRNYLKSKKVSEEIIFSYLCGVYNRGYTGMSNYIDEFNTVDTKYSNKVLYYKTKLETEGIL